jgi:hypothetical protein
MLQIKNQKVLNPRYHLTKLRVHELVQEMIMIFFMIQILRIMKFLFIITNDDVVFLFI